MYISETTCNEEGECYDRIEQLGDMVGRYTHWGRSKTIAHDFPWVHPRTKLIDVEARLNLASRACCVAVLRWDCEAASAVQLKCWDVRNDTTSETSSATTLLVHTRGQVGSTDSSHRRFTRKRGGSASQCTPGLGWPQVELTVVPLRSLRKEPERVLGMTLGHDASLAVVEDGVVLAALELERLFEAVPVSAACIAPTHNLP